MQELKDQAHSIIKTLSSVADVNIQIIDHIREQPELKQLTLEGVSLTLQDVDLTLPSQARNEKREAEQAIKFNSIEQRLTSLSQQVQNLLEVSTCLAEEKSSLVLQKTMINQKMDIGDVAGSLLKSAP